MNPLLKEWVPPALIAALRKQSPVQTPLFASYEAALNYCEDHAYQASDLVMAIVEKNVIYREKLSLTPVLPLEALRTIGGIGLANFRTTLRVLDFGGGGGTHYWIARAVFGNEKNIRWNVVETDAMVAAATSKLAERGLRFFTNIKNAAADLGDVDLAFTSGALPYTPDPLVFLSDLISVKAKHLFITRTAFNDDDDPLITVQTSLLSSNGPGPLPAGFKDREVRYPITFVGKTKAEQLLTSLYDIRFFIDEEPNAYTVEGKPLRMYGYFCDLKDELMRLL